MRFKNHLLIMAIVNLLWFSFYLIGLPSDYFLKWSSAEKMLITWIALFAIFPLAGFLIIVFLNDNYFKTSLWLAIYASAGPFLLDSLIVGLIQGHGMDFLKSHWYLTIGYFQPLVVMPLIGSAMMTFKNNLKLYNQD